jgi:AcrR family transcriptional regulator
VKTVTPDRQATDKRQAILDSALALFVEQGFHATSTASIARAAGVATGTLFHHFPSKEALLASLFLGIKQEFADYLLQHTGRSGILKQDANDLWQAAIDWSLAQPPKQAFFQQYSQAPGLDPTIRAQAMHEILGFIGELIAQGQQAGLLADYPLELMLENCHGQYLAATRFFVDRPELGRDDNYRQASFELFWRAMRP